MQGDGLQLRARIGLSLGVTLFRQLREVQVRTLRSAAVASILKDRSRKLDV